MAPVEATENCERSAFVPNRLGHGVCEQLSLVGAREVPMTVIISYRYLPADTLLLPSSSLSLPNSATLLASSVVSPG